MARMARTQTAIGATNGGMPSVQPQRFNHAQSQIISEGAGLDPFRGDLTNAFNQFFGQVNSSLQTIQDANWQIRRQEAENIRNERRLEAEALARDTFMENPDMSAADIPGYVSSLSSEQSQSRTFLTTYRDTLGANIGDRMYGDFSLYMQDRNPANFEADAQRYWEENYGNGTGDPYVDNAMSAAWSRNYERARVTAAQQAISNARAAAWENTQTAIYSAMGPGFSQGDWATAFSNVQAQFPFESSGRTASRTLAVMAQAAVHGGPEAVQAFTAFLDAAPDNGDGTTGQSLSERFPRQVAELRAATYDQLLRFTTLSGAEAVQQGGETLAGIMAEPDEFTRLEGLTGFLTTDIGALMNTPGVSYRGVMELRGQAEAAVAEAQQVVLTQNRIHAGVTQGNWDTGITSDDIEGQSYDYLVRNADFINSAEDGLTVRAGNAMRALFDRAGSDAFSDDVRDYFAYGITHTDPAVVGRTFQALTTLDNTANSTIIGDLFSEHAQALTRFRALETAPTVAGGAEGLAAVMTSPEVQAAVAEIADAGGAAGILFANESSNADRSAAFAEAFHGSDMAERFQEVLGLDTLFGGWGSPNLSPQVRQRINEVVEQEMALLSARGETYTDIADLRNRAAETLAGSIYIMNDVVYLRGSGPVTGDEMDLNMVPLGHGVRNPNTGEMEDTLSRMMEDVAGITDGFTGIVLDTDNISVRPTDYLSAHNGYQLIDNTTNRPLMIAVGETYQIDREYDETGAERWQAAVWWNGGDEVQFSGDAEHDQALMTQILPPGVSLLPHTDADGNVIAYEMFVAPRWEGQTRYTMEDLMQMADEGQLTIDQIPPDRRLEFLGRQMTQEMWDNGRMVRMTDAVETALGDEGIAEIEAYLEGVNNPEPAPVEEPVATGDFNQRLDTLITSYEETGVLDPAILASMPEWMHDMDPDLLMTVLYETQRLQNERN